nr:hypothetical protein [Tanacetum cinerariifolium]
MGQDRQMKMIEGNGRNQFRQYAGQNAGNLNGYNAVQNVRNQVAQNPRVQNVRNQNRLIGVQGNRNQNQIGIQLQAEEYDLMAAAADLDEIEEVNANCILIANLQQALSSGTQTDYAPVYDSDGSAEVHEYANCYNNEIFNMFTQEEQYTELLEPIPEPQQVPHNDNNVIFEVTDVEQGGETKEVDELKAERLAKIQDPLALMANSINPYVSPAPHQDVSPFNQTYLQQPMPNPEDITDPTTAMNMALSLMAKVFKLNYSTPTNNNQRISSNPRNRQIAQPGMNMGQDRQMQMIGGNGNQNQIGNGNLVAVRAEGILAIR